MAAAVGHLSSVKAPKNRRPLSTNPVDTWDAVEKTMSILELITNLLNNGNYDDILFLNLTRLMNSLPQYGPLIEEAYQGQLDRAFKVFRDACRDEHLNEQCRVKLMALIERRAMNWQKSESFEQYYRSKIPSPECESQPIRVDQFQGAHSTLPTMITPTIPLLGPGEQIKSSGRFPQPTRVPGKNYYKDEVVINNADSGKVMGIKGRRVHMIEELSETIISFQRVTPGVKERLVQITGPSEVRINEAVHLMEDTIRRNASPVPFRVDQPDVGSSSSVNSSASEESNRIQTGHHQSNHRLQHSFSTNDASPEYKHTVTVGPHTIKLTGTNYDLVTESKIILERHFGDRDIFLLDDQCIPDDIIPLEVKQTMQQPFFPEVSKAVGDLVECAGKSIDLSVHHRLSLFGHTDKDEKNFKAPKPKKYLRYSRDMIYALANSQLSMVEPDNWESLCPSALIKVFHHVLPKKTATRSVSDPQFRPATLDLSNYNLPKTPTPSKPQRRVSFDPHFQTEEDWETDNSPSLTADFFARIVPEPVRSRSLSTPTSLDPNYNVPKPPTPSKPQRWVSFDPHFQTEEEWETANSPSLTADFSARIVSEPVRSRSLSTPTSLEPSRARSISPGKELPDASVSSPTTTIPFRPNFKFSKKSSLPEMAVLDSPTSPIPFNRSESSHSLKWEEVDDSSESTNPKQTKSFRPQLTNPKLGFLRKPNP